ncbi:MAG: roadblock/LC7 domain-containing protein, partial [Limisphaerales bacterium]
PPPAGTPTPSDAGPIRMNAGDLEKLSQPKPAAPAAPVSPAIKPVSPPQAESPLPGTKLPGATARPTIPAPTSTLPTATQATTTTPSSPGTVAVPVNQVIDSLPDAIKGSLIQAKAQNASFHLPAADLEKSLKSGKVVFSWKTLRTSLQPATMSSTTPAADQIEVTLPLHIVAPLFLATHKPAAPQKKVAIAQDIPDVFANRQVATETPAAPETPAPPAPAPQAPIPTSTPAQAPQHSIPIPVPAIPPPNPVQAPATQTIGEIFGQTGRTSWTPAEIAQNTTTLPGVSGAIVALPDGLLVAAKLAPGLDPDTIAAFLPQMYGRTSQYTKELRLGDPKKITFIVDDMPLLIYRGSGVFFGVFGQNGETLPNPQLDVIAAQLGA